MSDIRPVLWDEGRIRLLDQTALPLKEVDVVCEDVDTLVDAINRLVVRGAPALGVVGGFGVALAIAQGERESWDKERLQIEIARIRNARPTAVNLAWGVDQVIDSVDKGLSKVLELAHKIAEEDEAANRQLSKNGADWILKVTGKTKLRVLTHCNTGSLATSTWGTGLGIIRELHSRGAIDIVYADETRPL